MKESGNLWNEAVFVKRSCAASRQNPDKSKPSEVIKQFSSFPTTSQRGSKFFYIIDLGGKASISQPMSSWKVRWLLNLVELFGFGEMMKIFMPVRKCGKALHMLSATPGCNSTCSRIIIQDIADMALVKTYQHRRLWEFLKARWHNRFFLCHG